MFLQTRCKIDTSGKCTFEKEWILTILVYVCYIASNILSNPTPSPYKTVTVTKQFKNDTNNPKHKEYNIDHSEN